MRPVFTRFVRVLRFPYSYSISCVAIHTTICLFQVLLGPNGVEEVLPFGPLSAFEQKGLDAMLPDLIAQAKKGVEFCK